MCVVLHSSVVGRLGGFFLLADTNNVTVNIYVEGFVWTYVFFLLSIYGDVAFLGPTEALHLAF